MKRLLKIVDYLLLLIIVLSVFQLILDDVGIIYFGGNKDFQKWMTYSAFFFDFIFSVEFIVRTVHAIRNKIFRTYFFTKGGWVDFLASLPLLLLNSGPLLIFTLLGRTETGARSIANMLKIIKAIRVTRILRILRLLKIFGRIENVFSNIVQHHIASITSMVVFISILTFMALHISGFIVYEDVIMEAKLSLLLSSIMIADIFVITIFYSAHMAKNISDPIYVMKRGFKELDYNYLVKINKDYQDDEVFELAKYYNTIWLPIKAKVIAANKKKLDKKEADKDDYSDLL